MEGKRGAIRIGISGWRYAPWRGVFYPKGLPQRRELEYASRALSTIEVNGSFYSLRRPESYALWHDQTPAHFVFSVKGPRFVTHILRLRAAEVALANFFASGVANLRDKLGPFLWQLPPNFRYDADQIEAFLALLPRDADAAAALARRRNDKVKGRARLVYGPTRPIRHALEVRNTTFVTKSFITMLRRQRVALVIADTAGKWPEYEDITADFAYVRLHGADELYRSGYSEEALDRWGSRILDWSHGREPPDAKKIATMRARSAASRDVYCYFDNTDKMEAPRNAARLAEKLEVAWRSTE